MFVTVVAPLVHAFALSVHIIPPIGPVFSLENGVANWVHLEVSLHILYVELGKREYLGYLAVATQVLLLEYAPAVLVNYILVLVYEVAAGVD